jgi:hypothetical protein
MRLTIPTAIRHMHLRTTGDCYPNAVPELRHGNCKYRCGDTGRGGQKLCSQTRVCKTLDVFGQQRPRSHEADYGCLQAHASAAPGDGMVEAAYPSPVHIRLDLPV